MSQPQSHNNCCLCPSITLCAGCVQGILSASTPPQQYRHHRVDVETRAQKNPYLAKVTEPENVESKHCPRSSYSREERE